MRERIKNHHSASSPLPSRNSVTGNLITTRDTIMAAAVEDKKQQQIEVAGDSSNKTVGRLCRWERELGIAIQTQKSLLRRKLPRRKDMDHMAFFCGGCRYRVTAYPDWTAQQVKEALFNGGIARSNKPEEVRNTPGIQKWEDIELIYAGQKMANDKTLETYHVPPGCKCLIAIEGKKLELGKPDKDSAYWN
eukprot:jgi/Picre1/30850/NNA_006209.t1